MWEGAARPAARLMRGPLGGIWIRDWRDVKGGSMLFGISPEKKEDENKPQDGENGRCHKNAFQSTSNEYRREDNGRQKLTYEAGGPQV